MVTVTPVFDHHHHHSQRIQKPEQMKNSALRSGKFLYLEKYLAFLQSQDSSSLTVEQLKMIVSIHGFKKPEKRKEAEEAVMGIEPINPVRSSLQGNISSSINATISLNEAIKDLRSLNWQECSITSIKTINNQNDSIISNLPSKRVTKARTQKTRKKKPEIASSMSCSSSGPSSNSSSSKNQFLALALPVKTDTSKGLRKPMLKKRKFTKVNELA